MSRSSRGERERRQTLCRKVKDFRMERKVLVGFTAKKSHRPMNPFRMNPAEGESRRRRMPPAKPERHAVRTRGVRERHNPALLLLSLHPISPPNRVSKKYGPLRAMPPSTRKHCTVKRESTKGRRGRQTIPNLYEPRKPSIN